jgi:hypothetical protein
MYPQKRDHILRSSPILMKIFSRIPSKKIFFVDTKNIKNLYGKILESNTFISNKNYINSYLVYISNRFLRENPIWNAFYVKHKKHEKKIRRNFSFLPCFFTGIVSIFLLITSAFSIFQRIFRKQNKFLLNYLLFTFLFNFSILFFWLQINHIK